MNWEKRSHHLQRLIDYAHETVWFGPAVTGPNQTNSPQTAPLLAIIYNQAIYKTITACYYT